MSIMHHLDYYKLTMGNVIYQTDPGAEVTFTLKNRGDVPLVSKVDPAELRLRLGVLERNPFTTQDAQFLSSLRFPNGEWVLNGDYLAHIKNLTLPEVNVSTTETDLAITVTGPWEDVSLWETVIMAEVNELFYRDVSPWYKTEGHERLTHKIKTLRRNPDIRFVDFGTRRRFSLDWHRQVVERLRLEVPEQFVGTSNPGFADEFRLQPVGTYAHEMPMVWAGLSEKEGVQPLEGQKKMLEAWEEVYGPNLLIALTDTFGSEFFFQNFTEEQANTWTGFRHDSGDPFTYGYRVLKFYKDFGIDPKTKTLVFSDGLGIGRIVQLHEHFKDSINVQFGWGTSLTNDLGVAANNFVMKATKVNGIGTVKLSDVSGKHTGTPEQIQKYIELRDQALTPVN